MDNPAYHPDPSNERISIGKRSEVFSVSRSLSVKQNKSHSTSSDHLVPVYSRASLLKRPELYRLATISLAVVCLLLLITLIVIIAFYSPGKILNQYCATDECLRAAANFKYSMDLSVNPCEDFYKYSCGHWSEEHPNHGWFTSFSSFTAVSERIILESYNFLISNDNSTEPVMQSKRLYRSCMDQESKDEIGFIVLFDYLEKVGLPKIPTIFSSSVSDNEKFNYKTDWLKIEMAIKKIFRKDVYFGFTVDVNIYNVSENVMYIGSPGNQCPLPSPFRSSRPMDKSEFLKQSEVGDPKKKELKDKIRGEVMKYIVNRLMKNLTSETPSDALLDQAAFVINNITNTINEMPRSAVVDPEDLLKILQEHRREVGEAMSKTIASYLFGSVSVNFVKTHFPLVQSIPLSNVIDTIAKVEL